MEKRQRGNEILRIARRWKEMRQSMHEGEGDNLRAMSLTHDDDDDTSLPLFLAALVARAPFSEKFELKKFSYVDSVK